MTTPMLVSYDLPAPLDAIPSPPREFVASNEPAPRGLLPTAVELSVIDDAIEEIARSHDLHEIFRQSLPPRLLVVVHFQRAAYWSAMRAKLRAFDDYCRQKEEADWRRLRELVARMRPLFDVAVRLDGTLLARFPKLAIFLEPRREAAKRAVATRKANKEAVARGEPATHGKVGRRKIKAAEKAALAAQEIADPTRP